MSLSSSMRRTSLAPLVRTEAEISQPGDLASPAMASSPAGIPGAIYTPHGGTPMGRLPGPDSLGNTAPQPLDGDKAKQIDYQFTLMDLNKRSYYLIHEAEAAKDPPEPSDPLLASLRRHLRAAVLLANLEVCVARNWQLARKDRDLTSASSFSASTATGAGGRQAPAENPYCLNLRNPTPGPTNNSSTGSQGAGADKQLLEEHERAIAPVAHLVSPERLYTLPAVSALLEEQVAEVEKLLNDPGCLASLRECNERTLIDLAYAFAAFQPAVLDEDIKGSQSPYDPRSHTRSIGDVRRLVAASVREAGVRAPARLALLGKALLETVVVARPEAPFPQCLLQSGCMCGHSELVRALLNHVLGCPLELDIIRRLRSSWLGYRGGKALQAPDVWAGACRANDNNINAARAGAGAPRAAVQGAKPQVRMQTLDWLDFKCSVARAVLIAHKVIETVIARDDEDLTQSLQLSYGRRGGRGSGAASAGATPAAAAAAAAEGEAGAQDGAGAAEGLRNGGSGTLLAAVLGAERRRPSLGEVLLDQQKPAELEERKWRCLEQLFPRPAACKPLALAMLHVVVEGKRAIGKLKRRMEAEGPPPPSRTTSSRRGVGGAAENGGAGAGDDGDDEGDEDEDNGGGGIGDEGEERMAEEEEEEEKARQAEKDRAARYAKLHLLAVQACHVAVHSGSLSTMSDAVLGIQAVRAWPALDLRMLNDLATHFPGQAAGLLEAVPLQVVEMEDNVLPFGLSPGFITVAVSDKDAEHFAEGDRGGSTQDAEHFATQLEEDVSIDASLLVQMRTWLALLFLFCRELWTPTSRKLLRVGGCALKAFAAQGPGSLAVAVAVVVLLGVLGLVSRMVVAVVRILWWSVGLRLWEFAERRSPALGRAAKRMRGRQGSTTGPAGGAISARIAPSSSAATGGGDRAGGSGGDGDGGDSGSSEDEEDGGGLHRFKANLSRCLWNGFVAHGHNAVIDGAVGWGKGAASISCRKVPMPIPYAPAFTTDTATSSGGTGPHGGAATFTPRNAQHRTRTGAAASAFKAPHPQQPRGPHEQLDTALLRKLLQSPEVPPSAFGSKVLRALILFKWNYFTKYFIILQFLLHAAYMAVFLSYAFSIKDMEPLVVDGDGVAGESGQGADTPNCPLPAPTDKQKGLLIALTVMTVDFAWQESRQLYHFHLRYFTHPWDLLDLASVALVYALIGLHLRPCLLVHASPLTLRGLAAVQVVLLFMRLLYYAMASDKLGSFVRMVIETTYDLCMFFGFLSVAFVGFALAIIVAQGPLADEEQTFIKMFTMMYGDFDVDFLSNIDSGALGLDELTRVLASLYMILVGIILLNLLISIISESYERIRENERWECLRNKALLVVESEAQLYGRLRTWLYRTLTAPSGGGGGGSRGGGGSGGQMAGGGRYLYVIAPEYARRPAAAAEEDEDDEDEEEDGDEEETADGQWNGRLGEMKRHISVQGRATLDAVRKELGKMKDALEEHMDKQLQSVDGNEDAGGGGDGDRGGGGGTSGNEGGAVRDATGEQTGRVMEGSVGGRAGGAVALDEQTLQLIAAQVGALVGRQVEQLRGALKEEVEHVAKTAIRAAAAKLPPPPAAVAAPAPGKLPNNRLAPMAGVHGGGTGGGRDSGGGAGGKGGAGGRNGGARGSGGGGGAAMVQVEAADPSPPVATGTDADVAGASARKGAAAARPS